MKAARNLPIQSQCVCLINGIQCTHAISYRSISSKSPVGRQGVNEVPSAVDFGSFLSVVLLSRAKRQLIRRRPQLTWLLWATLQSTRRWLTLSSISHPKRLELSLYELSLESPIPRSFVDEINFAIRAKAFRKEPRETPFLARILLKRSLSVYVISFLSESLLPRPSRVFSRIRGWEMGQQWSSLLTRLSELC